MINLFAGYDPGESDGFHVFTQSVLEHSSVPVSITPLHLPMMKFYSDHNNKGTNAFIQSRFLIPFLMNYRGWAIFADGADMIFMDDIANLADLYDPFYAVQVVKHDYKTKHDRKYIGTPLENDNIDYPRKNWSSLMIINCGHHFWHKVTPTTLETKPNSYFHRFEFIDDRNIGELPKEWNWLVSEYDYNPDAKLAHYTLGIPSFEHYKDCDYSDEWRQLREKF